MTCMRRETEQFSARNSVMSCGISVFAEFEKEDRDIIVVEEDGAIAGFDRGGICS